MRNIKHTQALWEVNEDAAEINSGKTIVVQFSQRFTKKEKTNAIHIVDCVNACNGINPKAVPNMLNLLQTASDCLKSGSYEIPGWDVLKVIEKINSVISQAKNK